MSTMTQRIFIILTFFMAGCSSDVFSQRQIPLFESSQSYLGVRIRDITASEVGNLQLPGESGVFIVRVEENSPAAQADLQEGMSSSNPVGLPSSVFDNSSDLSLKLLPGDRWSL